LSDILRIASFLLYYPYYICSIVIPTPLSRYALAKGVVGIFSFALQKEEEEVDNYSQM